jgi:hypothetical protein
MKAPELAHAYVTLDRFVYFQLQKSSAFQSRCASVKQRLKDNEGLKDFEKLCDAGSEADELLWLLAGCEGLPGFINAEEVFGWSASELRKGLAALEKAANVIEKMDLRPFGLLVRHANVTFNLDKRLRSYLRFARAAQSDFGHGSEWFLNIAKARLVLHVIHRTAGEPHDNEVSGLIAAVTKTEYNADAQKRWRHKHNDLIQNAELDPYTITGQAGRQQVRQSWEQIAAQDPEFFKGFDIFADDYSALSQSRRDKPGNHQRSKK